METTVPRNLLTPDQHRAQQNYADAYNGRHEFYEGKCPEHGWTRFVFKSQKCTLCRKRPGRNYSDSPRAVARRTGAKEYPGTCDTHGLTLFDVAQGKCLTCFTTMGAPRKGSSGEPARAQARREGRSTYAGECDTHGTAPFGVRYGKCLRCFTIDGKARSPKREWEIGN